MNIGDPEETMFTFSLNLGEHRLNLYIPGWVVALTTIACLIVLVYHLKGN